MFRFNNFFSHPINIVNYSEFTVKFRYGDGAGWRRILSSPSPSPYAHILTRYSTHTQRGWEIESHPRLQWVRVFPHHPRPCTESICFNKKRVFLSFNDNVVMHYPTICTHFNIFLSNNSVAPLTINESSYIITIIKPNNMAYHYQPPQQKQKHDLSTFG